MRTNSKAIKKTIIINCNDNYTPKYFGRVYNLAKELSIKNNVYLISITNENFKFKANFESVNSLRIIRITIPQTFFSFLIQTCLFLLITSYLRIFKKVHLIMATNPIPGLATTIISNILRIKSVFDFLDNFRAYPVWQKHPFLYSIVENFITHYTKNFIFASPSLQEDFNRKYTKTHNNSKKTKQAMIPNGVDVRLFHPMEKIYARKKTTLPPNSKIILYSGAIDHTRGINTLCKAFSYLIQELPGTELHLVITGKGEALPDLLRLASKLNIQNKFLYIGWVPHNQIPLYINSADITVLPMMKHEFTKVSYTPLKLMEYMACSKPIVITNVGETAKLMENERGLIVPPEDPKKMAYALKTLLTDEELGYKLGLNAYKLTIKNFSWNNLVSKFDLFLE